MMDHSQAEDKDTISSILGTLFSERSDEEVNTMLSERTNQEAVTMVPERSDEEADTTCTERSDREAIAMSPVTLDEEGFEPLVKQGEGPSIPTEEELIKYPELEYSSRKVQDIVDKMDKTQQQEFREYEQYFLTQYRQTGNM